MDTLGLVLLEHRIEKLMRNIKKVIKKYPKLNLGLDQGDLVTSFIDKVFSIGLDSTIYMSNRTLNNDGKYTICIRPKITPLLESQTKEGVSFMLKGTVDFTRSKSPDFVIQGLFEVQDKGVQFYEVEQGVQIYLYNQRDYNRIKSTVLTLDIIEDLPSISQITQERLNDWFDYIEWRNTVLESRLEGLYVVEKNISEYIDEFDERQFNLEITVIANSEVEMNRFNNKYIRSLSMALLKEEASSEPYTFTYNNESRERELLIGDGKCLEKNTLFGAKLDEELQINYPNPTFSKFSFKIEDSIILKKLNEVTADNLGEVVVDILKTKYKGYVFLVPSLIGDFILLKRQQRAIEALDYEDNESPFIANWLFDIEQANLPDETTKVEIDTWGIDDLNDSQKRAVQGMLNAPDIFLVQGPPGTGKTTVIAEAIHQFVKQGKKVLLTSQANLAVDNVFERLTTSPDIRMIRLGRASKISEDAKMFAEQEVLKTFYNSIDSAVTERFTGTWKNQDEKLNELRLFEQKASYLKADFEKFSANVQAFQAAYNEVAEKHRQLDRIASETRIKNEEMRVQRYHLERAVGWVNQKGEELTTLTFEQLKKLWSIYIQPTMDFELFQHANVDWAQQNKAEFLATFKLNVSRMQHFIQFIPVVDQDLQRLQTGTTASAEQLLEIETLESRKREIEKYLATADGIKYFEEFQKIIQQIEALKQSGTLSLHDDYNKISYFNQSLKSVLEKEFESQNKSKISQILFQLKDYLLNLQAQLPIKQQLANDYLKTQLQLYKEEPIDEEGLLKADVAKQHAFVELQEGRKALSIVEQQLQGFLQTVSAYLEVDVTYGSIESELQLAQMRLNEQRAGSQQIRTELEPLLKEWQKRLQSKEQARFDKEHFIETYIKACNVVGISCTENPRELDKTDHVEFDVAIIDEVSKATPPEMLIPMVRARKTILVGDHRQLPPIFSEHTKQYKDHIEQLGMEDDDVLNEQNLDRFKNMVTASLFKEYFEQADDSIKTSLLVQYRMHPQIMSIINHFYEQQLTCGLKEPDVQRAHKLLIPSANGTSFIHPDKHCYWVDSAINPVGQFVEQQSDGTSFINELEALLIYETLIKLDEEIGKQNLLQKKDVGVISFYGKQVRFIRNLIRKNTKGKGFTHLKVDINTVDRFQGKEKSIVLVSMVRNKKMPKKFKRPNSHIASFQRINVAFSRAKELLVIFGAKSFYEDWPVELPKMDRSSDKPDVYEVYGAILMNIHKMGALFNSSDVINESQYKRMIEGEVVVTN